MTANALSMVRPNIAATVRGYISLTKPRLSSLVLITSTGKVRSATRIIETVAYVPRIPGLPAAIYVPGAEGDSTFAGNAFIVDGVKAFEYSRVPAPMFALPR